ncbi:single-stranded DNA-binding protein [Candidatus Shapirobacteria bacterium]|nr:single-stranded DNA-binding protein [Candidatus Shapirobacteria bacterium]
MAFSINLAIITGNLTRDPELRFTPSGQAVCSFGVATNRSIKKGEQWEDVPTFHNVVQWGKPAEFTANNLKKGMKVTVTGRIDNRSYDAKDGTKKYISEIVADTVIGLTDHRGGGTQASHDSSNESAPLPDKTIDAVEDIVIPDEMPF